MISCSRGRSTASRGSPSDPGEGRPRSSVVRVGQIELHGIGRYHPVPTVQHWEAELQDLPAGVDNPMGAATMGKCSGGLDPARFERLADGARDDTG
jgi:hypothetical protein